MKIIYLLVAVVLYPIGLQAQKREKNLTADTRPKLEQGATTADGKRLGKWQFYNNEQKLELTFDYDSSRISYLQPDTTRYLIRIGDQWQPKQLTRAPHLLGSNDQRLMELTRRLRYPVSALQQQLQGTVVLGYTVDINGHTRDYTIGSSLSPDCDQEVWRALKDLPDSWIPAVYLGRPTPSRFYLAVKFEMATEASLAGEQREQKRLAKLAAAGTGLLSVSITRPRYAHEVVVRALGIERSTRFERVGR